MSSRWFWPLRGTILTLTFTLNLALLALAIQRLVFVFDLADEGQAGNQLNYLYLALAAGIIGFFILFSTIIGMIGRRRNTLSTVLAELIGLGIICVFWFATSILFIIVPREEDPGCGYTVVMGSFRRFEVEKYDPVVCSETIPMQALSFALWVILFLYLLLLLVASYVSQRRGENVWTKSIHKDMFVSSTERGHMPDGDGAQTTVPKL